jgi:hypothetical protein
VKTYCLSGDLRVAATVKVTAATEDEAVAKAERGEFDEVVEEIRKDMGFEFNGEVQEGGAAVSGAR